MGLCDMLAVVTSVHDDSVLSCAVQLASQTEARVTAVAIGWKPEPPAYSEAWLTDDRWDKEAEISRQKAETLRQHAADYLAKAIDNTASESLLADPQAPRRLVGLRARHADLALVGRPSNPLFDDVHTPLVEGLLFESGRPVLIVPPGWRRGPVGRNIVVCWNGSRESSRAVADAMPFIRAADAVLVLSVGVKRDSETADASAHDIAASIRRHGPDVSVRRLDPGTSTDAMAMLEAAAAARADMIVMGGYGRSRLSEMVFGGVTREMLAGAQLPVLMSH